MLSKGERAFWHPLKQAVCGRFRVFCKLRLADVVGCPPGQRDERRWFQRIARFHVDFVLCDLDTTAPLLVIELDDRRHRDCPRKALDAFKDEVLRAAGLPVLRVKARAHYEPVRLAQLIESSMLHRVR